MSRAPCPEFPRTPTWKTRRVGGRRSDSSLAPQCLEAGVDRKPMNRWQARLYYRCLVINPCGESMRPQMDLVDPERPRKMRSAPSRKAHTSWRSGGPIMQSGLRSHTLVSEEIPTSKFCRGHLSGQLTPDISHSQQHYSAGKSKRLSTGKYAK